MSKTNFEILMKLKKIHGNVIVIYENMLLMNKFWILKYYKKWLLSLYISKNR